MFAAGDHVGKTPRTYCGEQRVAGVLGCGPNPVRCHPGQERLTHTAQQRRGRVVDKNAYLTYVRAGYADPAGRGFHATDEPGEDAARRVVTGGLVALVRGAGHRAEVVQ